jgi:glycerol-3-phosphate dehydrogenase
MNQLRTNCIERARNEVQDCLVVGAGINGAVSAAALAGKGARVTIIDKGDFASCTSQESSNLAWGGIKYLETFEFRLVWNLCKSRNELMRAYPTQVREVRFHTSVAKGFRIPRIILYCGTLLYWLMGRCQTKPPRWLSVERIRKESPMIETGPLSGGLIYSDGRFIENDARFAFDFIRKVIHKNNNAINYMELKSAEWRNGMWHCTLHNHVNGEPVPLKAKTLVNATGPFADKVNAMLGVKSPFKHVFSKGSHIIVPRVVKGDRVLTFFASDNRLFFMVPMGHRTCIGTTDTRVDSENIEATADDVDFLLSNANDLLHLEKPLGKEDIIAMRCGVRPLVVKKGATVGDADWTALSRRHEIDIHPERNLCIIYGGKLTDCINIGEKVSETVRLFGVALFQSLERWYGEPSAQKRSRFDSECRRHGLEEKQGERLWRRYGTEAFQCLDMIRHDPGMAEKVIGEFIRAELHLIAGREMVVHLEDFLRRRSYLALTEHRATLRCAPGLPEAARILFGERADTEIERYFSKPRS